MVLLLADCLQLVAASGSMQKATIHGLDHTGHPEGATNYHRRPCIPCCWFLRVEQLVIIDTECTFVACI